MNERPAWTHGEFLDRVSGVATGGANLLLLSLGERLALALPGNRRASRLVINLYQPRRWKGRLFQLATRIAVALELPRLLGKRSQLSDSLPSGSPFEAAAANGSIGFLRCNPNHGPRCILTGIDPSNDQPFIAKLGFDQSREAVLQEHRLLESLAGKHPGVVTPLGMESGDDWAVLRLPHLGHDIPDSLEHPAVLALLESWTGQSVVRIGHHEWASRLLDHLDASFCTAGWLEQLKQTQVRSALIHGDFALWNLRLCGENVVAIDWEWSVPEGLAGIDLAHALRQEAYLVRRLAPAEVVDFMRRAASSPTWKPYLATIGWGDDIDSWIRLGLLHSHFNAKNDSRELLAELDIRL